MEIYERIKDMAKKRGLTIKDLEVELGFVKNSLYKWKKASPSIDRVDKVARYFHVSLDALLGRGEEEFEDDHSPRFIYFYDLKGYLPFLNELKAMDEMPNGESSFHWIEIDSDTNVLEELKQCHDYGLECVLIGIEKIATVDMIPELLDTLESYQQKTIILSYCAKMLQKRSPKMYQQFEKTWCRYGEEDRGFFQCFAGQGMFKSEESQTLNRMGLDRDYMSDILEQLNHELKEGKEKVIEAIPPFGIIAVSFRKEALLIQRTMKLLEKEWSRQYRRKEVDWPKVMTIYQELTVEYHKFTQFLSQPGVYNSINDGY
jgi:transcriptional regulator with XRE-family HTH domain